MHTFPRLLDTFVPAHYDLSLTIHRQKRTFAGTVTITGNALHHHHLSVHAKDLAITSATVDGKKATTSHDEDILTIHHDDIHPGEHIVVIHFSGVMTDSMHGMYPCYYTVDGEKKELVATQFESHHAREVFPCVDEPAAKATFAVTLSTDDTEVIVLSNMPESSRRIEDGLLVTVFETTPIMSSYLLAWVIGDLHKVSGKTANDVEVSIWATKAQPKKSLTFALEVATRTIDFFDDFFATPYPLPKSDHVALPDFSSGAMENWGLVTYREVALIVDPAHSSVDHKQRAALVIAHELSHQWFGNLVTMAWWNDLWLNESFASVMEYVALDALYPEWDIWLEFNGNDVIHALRRDALDGVQPISVTVSHPDEIATLFDPSIVYAKGARLLRMLETYIGDEAMRKGLQTYFARHAYGNTVSDDLWSCLSEASGEDVAGVMHTWMNQAGYPVITATVDDNKHGSIILTQQQFFIGQKNSDNRLWRIPLVSTDPALPPILDTPSIWVTPSQHPLSLNHNSASHYITHYDEALLNQVLSSVDNLTTANRLKIIHEQLLLVQAEIAPPTQLLRLLDAFRHEKTEAVWGALSVVISEIRKFIATDEEADAALRKFVADLARQEYQLLGWDEKPHESLDTKKLRPVIIGLMLYGEDPEALQQAADRYDSKQIERLDPELRVSILSTAVRRQQPATAFTELLQHYKKTQNSELQNDLAMAITSTKQPTEIDTILTVLTDADTIKPQDAAHWIVWTMRNRYGTEATWTWLQSHWNWIDETFSTDKSYDAYPRYVASVLSTPQHLKEYTDFFTPKLSVVALRRNIEVGLGELAHRVNLIKTHGPALRKLLKEL